MINEIKMIIENYLNNAKLPALLVGTYTGGAVAVNEKFRIPAAQLSGNLKGQLKSGDRVRLLAGTGWREYYILEVIGRSQAFKDEIRSEALK